MNRANRVILWGCAFWAIGSVAQAGEDVQPKPEDWSRRLELLQSVPYVALSESSADEADTGVVFLNPELAYEGYNLYVSRRSGDVNLIDMEGRLRHRWECTRFAHVGGYHHVHLLENGDLYVIRDNMRLYRINWNTDLLWEKKVRAHHDIAVLPDGSFYIIANHLRDYRGIKVFFDSIIHLAENGEEVNRWSTYEHLDEIKRALEDRLFLDTILDSIKAGGKPTGGVAGDVKRALGSSREAKVDYFHLNTVSVLPETPLGQLDRRFAKGNLLVCFRNVNQIAILERGTYRIVWSWGAGDLQWPHQPTLLENGRILIFDNGVERGFSRLLELDPLAEEIVWQYTAEPPEAFFTSGGGSAQRLPNGNTLISETNSGRVFEITPDGNVVWVWMNPVTWRDRRETIYRMTRVPGELVEPLLKRQWPVEE